MRRFGLFLFGITLSALAVPPDQKHLPVGLAPWERAENGRALYQTEPPVGKIHSLAEWEESDAVMTLWPNASLLSALQDHGDVLLFADSFSETQWWTDFLTSHGVPTERFSFFIVPTDSIWVRDYGPWFILDGAGTFGLVDTKYNRPRPQDDLVPQAIGEAFGIPVYEPGLVHTGGNYYNDGLDDAFSSTLVYSENASLSSTQVNQRMQAYLGIEKYTTSRLAPSISIEHMDTFGKLVTPDTWVFSEFPTGSRYRADSEAMAAKLATLTSPYGTPYKILRLKMRLRPGFGGENYRAYINSFISNHALYFPTYGDPFDEEAKLVYQAALPGYDIVGVDNDNTSWGDSVHCRTRNLLKKDTVFIFPYVSLGETGRTPEIRAAVFPSPGEQLDGAPRVHWRVGENALQTAELLPQGDGLYALALPEIEAGSTVRLYVEATDTGGRSKTAPQFPDSLPIEIQIR